MLMENLFSEIAPLYSPALTKILETICRDAERPIIVMINERDDNGDVITDDEGNPSQRPSISHANILYHINRVWNPFFYGEELFIYDPELHYHRIDTGDVVRNVMACVMANGHTIKPTQVKAIVDQIVNHTAAYPFGGSIGTLNFANGVFNADTGEIKPHSKNNFFDYVVYTPYETFYETPELYEFMDAYGNREPIAVLAKALWQRCYLDTLKELTVFYGDKDTGKTTFAELIQSTLDGNLNCKANSSRVLLNELLQRFGMAGLEHKTINIGDDLPDTFIRNSGRINELVGSVHHNVEKKGIDHFATILPAYNVFTTNNLPPLDDDDLCIWSKIRLVVFRKKFIRGTVRENLFTDTIKKQLLYRAVELMQSWKITPYKNDQNEEDVRTLWNEAATSTDTFVAECLSVDWTLQQPTHLTEIERVYGLWCIENRKPRYIKFLRRTIKPHLTRKSTGNGYNLKIHYKPKTKEEGLDKFKII